MGIQQVRDRALIGFDTGERHTFAMRIPAGNDAPGSSDVQQCNRIIVQECSNVGRPGFSQAGLAPAHQRAQAVRKNIEHQSSSSASNMPPSAATEGETRGLLVNTGSDTLALTGAALLAPTGNNTCGISSTAWM